jgi:hypothetical protein
VDLYKRAGAEYLAWRRTPEGEAWAK